MKTMYEASHYKLVNNRIFYALSSEIKFHAIPACLECFECLWFMPNPGTPGILLNVPESMIIIHKIVIIMWTNFFDDLR